MRIAALLLVAVLAGCTSPSPGTHATPGAEAALPTVTPPPPPPAEGSSALHVGDSWTYTVTGRNGTTSQRTATVAEVRDGSAFVDTQGERPLRTELDVRTLAIRSASQSQGPITGSATFDPPLGIVIPAADHEWYGAITLRTPLGASSRTGHATVTFLGLERITVPAGDLACYHYAMDLESQGSPPFAQKMDIWYSPEAKAYAKQVSGNETQLLASYHLATPS